jgi:hypothetical protein
MRISHRVERDSNALVIVNWLSVNVGRQFYHGDSAPYWAWGDGWAFHHMRTTHNGDWWWDVDFIHEEDAILFALRWA